MATGTSAHRSVLSLLPPAVALFLLGACGGADPATDGQPAPRRVLTDANVTSIVTTANNAEIGEAQLALSRSRNAAVREFAQRMITDHRAANRQIMEVANRTGMQPDQLGTQIQTAAQQARESLEGRTGAEFDRAYIANQVSMHRWLLETIDNSLLPSARDQRLENVLASMRATVADHLRHAQQVQQTLR